VELLYKSKQSFTQPKERMNMNRRLRSFTELVNKNKQEIEKDPKALERIERKIDEKHTSTKAMNQKKIG
jgi:hypothetical protein